MKKVICFIILGVIALFGIFVWQNWNNHRKGKKKYSIIRRT